MAFARRPFMIVSEMNGKALDINKGQSRPGADVIMYQRKMDRSPNQLWYLDHSGIIRSMLNDFALEAKKQGDHFEMEPFNGAPRQQWIFDRNRIINRAFPGECMDIERAENKDGAHVIAWPYKGSINQHWRIDYV